VIFHTGKYEAMYHEPEVKLNNDVMLAMSGTAALIEPRRVDVNTNIPDHDLSVTLRVLPKLQRYTGTIRHHLKSRDWGGNHDGMSLFVEKVEQLPRGEARSKGRAALKSGLFAYQDLRRWAITNEKGQSTSDGSFADEEDSNDNDMSRNRGVRKKIKMFQVSTSSDAMKPTSVARYLDTSHYFFEDERSYGIARLNML
jgi:Histone deacetylation protein Rxt3